MILTAGTVAERMSGIGGICHRLVGKKQKNVTDAVGVATGRAFHVYLFVIYYKNSILHTCE